MPPSDDSELVRQAQRGDQAAFELLVRRYDRRVLRLALGLVRSQETARDLYQEAFLRIYRSIGRFRQECSIETWIYRVVTNVCLDHLRRAAADRAAGTGGPPGDERNEAVVARLVEDRPDLDPSLPRLGAQVEDLDDQFGEYFGVKNGDGVLVRSVRKGSPADSAGLRAGDVIVKVDDEAIADHSDLRGALRERRDVPLTLTVVRDRKEVTLKVSPPKRGVRSEDDDEDSEGEREPA